MDGIIKNPIIIGLFAGVVTYSYLSWKNNEENSKRKHKKHKKDINLMIPLMVAAIVWFLAYAYFECSPTSQTQQDQNIKQSINTSGTLPIPIPPTPGYKFIKDVVPESSENRAFSLLTPGVNIPKEIPDVWLDMF